MGYFARFAIAEGCLTGIGDRARRPDHALVMDREDFAGRVSGWGQPLTLGSARLSANWKLAEERPRQAA
jgi:hypothetical protein